MPEKPTAPAASGSRLRARWEVEDQGRGTWQIVGDGNPYQVQKSKLIEKLAELIQLKKVPILRRCPRRERRRHPHRAGAAGPANVDPRGADGHALSAIRPGNAVLSLNMNVLIDGRTPKVCLAGKRCLRAFLDHRRDVLLRRSQPPDGKDRPPSPRVLEGFIIAFLNLDRVIDIIRYDDEPKPALMREDWGRDFVRATSGKGLRQPRSR